VNRDSVAMGMRFGLYSSVPASSTWDNFDAVVL
jgi:hypothetical protein